MKLLSALCSGHVGEFQLYWNYGHYKISNNDIVDNKIVGMFAC